MKSFSIFLSALLLIATVSCKNETKEPEIETVDTAPEKELYPMPAMDAKFKDAKTEAIFIGYQKLQNALVNTDATKAAIEAKGLLAALQNIDAPIEEIEVITSVVESNEVEEQRASFVKVTAIVEGYLSDALDSGTLYKVYCPMAFKNTGASWLSSEKVVQNPYFGDKMYRCGRVEAAIE